MTYLCFIGQQFYPTCDLMILGAQAYSTTKQDLLAILLLLAMNKLDEARLLGKTVGFSRDFHLAKRKTSRKAKANLLLSSGDCPTDDSEIPRSFWREAKTDESESKEMSDESTEDVSMQERSQGAEESDDNSQAHAIEVGPIEIKRFLKWLFNENMDSRTKKVTLFNKSLIDAFRKIEAPGRGGRRKPLAKIHSDLKEVTDKLKAFGIWKKQRKALNIEKLLKGSLGERRKRSKIFIKIMDKNSDDDFWRSLQMTAVLTLRAIGYSLNVDMRAGVAQRAADLRRLTESTVSDECLRWHVRAGDTLIKIPGMLQTRWWLTQTKTAGRSFSGMESFYDRYKDDEGARRLWSRAAKAKWEILVRGDFDEL